ncbi:hypothetical protein JY651_05550 [Pyxidicoccus parkwayensis]|uniref:Uncharacterized protein n=1 Tax=Pyxidicoccus parkwayensis TaxID=2813578 RepID=A0ABX7P0A4_9BACT|nr:hypothetical protein [Pyxidicoccus parkwaysis]QSQ24423.1 hypothetical protein JY651_05550 [Pyxidicoccus parkwaysis]
MTTDFKLQLAETIAWCSARAVAERAGETTRSAELMSPFFQQDGDTQVRRLLDTPAVGAEVVDFIVRRRREALERTRQPLPPLGELCGGRVLMTDFNTDICAAATAPSNGFLDDYDIPGWDTWFAHEDTGRFGGVVYGWVPPALVELAERGFSVIPVECIGWVDATDLRRLLG